MVTPILHYNDPHVAIVQTTCCCSFFYFSMDWYEYVNYLTWVKTTDTEILIRCTRKMISCIKPKVGEIITIKGAITLPLIVSCSPEMQ